MSLPPSSPRLPSPPPPTEIQIGPKSPSLSDSSSGQDNTIEQSILDANSARRIHPGTKAADIAAGPPLVPLMELDSAFQLQEHLKALHFHHTKLANALHTIPISRSTASLIATPPDGVDRALWLYELCRFLINKCNDLIVGFLFDSPPCSSTTCPEMRASEWQFLCAVHETPKSCCAIDYCCHTLDWATNIVTSQKIFPSRLSLGAGDGLDERGAGVKHLVNIFRRLHRIFAHAWFQHRGIFWQIEGQTGLYVLFKTVCDSYELLPAENYKLPPEAEGLEPTPETKVIPTILKPEPVSLSNIENIPAEDQSFMGVNRTSTRRHIRSSPSTGSAVTTVLEADENDSDVTQKFSELSVTREEEAEADKTLMESDIKVNTESLAAPVTEAETDIKLEAQGDEAEIPVAVAPEEDIESPVDLPTVGSSSTHLEKKATAVSPVASDEPPSMAEEKRPYREEEEEAALKHSKTGELSARESTVPEVHINQL